MESVDAEDSTVTVFVTGSASTLAFGSTPSTAFVTLRAQPPQVMFSMWNCIRVSVVVRADAPLIRLPGSGRSSGLFIALPLTLQRLEGPSVTATTESDRMERQ